MIQQHGCLISFLSFQPWANAAIAVSQPQRWQPSALSIAYGLKPGEGGSLGVKCWPGATRHQTSISRALALYPSLTWCQRDRASKSLRALQQARPYDINAQTIVFMSTSKQSDAFLLLCMQKSSSGLCEELHDSDQAYTCRCSFSFSWICCHSLCPEQVKKWN